MFVNSIKIFWGFRHKYLIAFGETALHSAAINNSKVTAEVLISNGANINEKDEDGDTPLHIATINNSKETAEVLISYGAEK